MAESGRNLGGLNDGGATPVPNPVSDLDTFGGILLETLRYFNKNTDHIFARISLRKSMTRDINLNFDCTGDMTRKKPMSLTLRCGLEAAGRHHKFPVRGSR